MKTSGDGAESAGRPSAKRPGRLPERGLLMSLESASHGKFCVALLFIHHLILVPIEKKANFFTVKVYNEKSAWSQQ